MGKFRFTGNKVTHNFTSQPPAFRGAQTGLSRLHRAQPAQILGSYAHFVRRRGREGEIRLVQTGPGFSRRGKRRSLQGSHQTREGAQSQKGSTELKGGNLKQQMAQS